MSMKIWRILAIVLLGGIAASAEDWPQFRGPTGNGISADKGFPTEWSAEKGVQWVYSLPGRGSSSPAVTSQRVDITRQTDDDSLWVISLDRQTGILLRKTNVGRGSLAMQTPELAAHRQNAATPTPVADSERI